MPIARTQISGTPTGTIAANGTYVIGGAGDTPRAIAVVGITLTGWTGTITLAARVFGSGGTYQNIQYRNKLTGATVAAGTAIAATGIYEAEADGLDLALVVTGYSAGTLVVDAVLPIR